MLLEIFHNKYGTDQPVELEKGVLGPMLCEAPTVVAGSWGRSKGSRASRRHPQNVQEAHNSLSLSTICTRRVNWRPASGTPSGPRWTSSDVQHVCGRRGSRRGERTAGCSVRRRALSRKSLGNERLPSGEMNQKKVAP